MLRTETAIESAPYRVPAPVQSHETPLETAQRQVLTAASDLMAHRAWIAELQHDDQDTSDAELELVMLEDRLYCMCETLIGRQKAADAFVGNSGNGGGEFWRGMFVRVSGFLRGRPGKA